MKQIAIGVVLAIAAFLTGCASPGVFSGSAYLDSIEIAKTDVSALPDGRYAAAASVAVPLGSVAAYPRAEVEVTIAGGAYTAIELRSPGGLSRDPKFLDLEARMIAAQSPAVDGVSGASFTSKALQLAVVKAVSE
jgi:uncharacterized protein with FMN-binding domain